MLVIHGIKNCDSCKKANRWAQVDGIAHRFHDFRVEGLSEDLLDEWLILVGWEALLNKRSTSWRELPKDVQDAVTEETARALLLANPTLIKRPVFQLEAGDELVIGFTKDAQTALTRMLAAEDA